MEGDPAQARPPPAEVGDAELNDTFEEVRILDDKVQTALEQRLAAGNLSSAAEAAQHVEGSPAASSPAVRPPAGISPPGREHDLGTGGSPTSPRRSPTGLRLGGTSPGRLKQMVGKVVAERRKKRAGNELTDAGQNALRVATEGYRREHQPPMLFTQNVKHALQKVVGQFELSSHYDKLMQENTETVPLLGQGNSNLARVPSSDQNAAVRTDSDSTSLLSSPFSRSFSDVGLEEKDDLELMSSNDAAILTGQVQAETTLEGLLRSLKNYQPPMLKEEELRGKMGKDDDFNGKNLASIRARRMQLWLIMKGTFIIAVVLLELITFVLFQMLWKGDFICETIPIEAPVTASIRYNNLGIIIFLLTSHLFRTVHGLMNLGSASGLLPRWVISVAGRRHMSWLDTVPFVGFGICVPITIIVIEESIRTCEPELEMIYGRSPLERLHITVHFTRVLLAFHSLISLRSEFRHLMQSAVSGNKRRFIDSRFDLDLTYITDRLVAMALPCIAGAEYRNDIHVVSKFFTYRHYGKFQIFNLCEPFEESGNGNYDRELFYNQVCKVSMHDHNICRLQTLVIFAKQACAFLNLDEKNIVAIHCRGGKGRTGSFCSAVLLWSGFSRTAAHALGYFASRRTDLSLGGTVQGVSSPSQIRYVHYIEAIKYLDHEWVSKRYMLISRIIMRGVPLMHLRGCQITFVIETVQGVIYDHAKTHGLVSCTAPSQIFPFDIGNLPVFGDVAIRFFYFDAVVEPESLIDCVGTIGPGARSISYRCEDGDKVIGRQLLFVQFHTSFHDGPTLSFERHEIDGAYSAKPAKFAFGFSLDVFVSDSAAHTQANSTARAVFRLDTLLKEKRGIKTQPHPSIEQFMQDENSANATVMQMVFLDKTIGGAEMGPGSVTDVIEYKGLSQKAIGIEVSTKIGRQTQWSGRRLLEMPSRTADILRACGAQEKVFYKGQVVRDLLKMAGRERSLMYITSGVVACYPSVHLEWSHLSCYDPGSARDLLLRGKGDFVGVTDFMLGTGQDHLTAKVICISNEASILKLKISHQNKSVPQFFKQSIEAWQANELYESAGRFVNQLLVRTDYIVQTSHQMRVKHDVWASSEEDARAQQIHRLRVKFKIPLSLHCYGVFFCKIREGGNKGALFGHLRCRVFIFSEAVYIVGRTGDVAYPMSDFLAVETRGRLLVLKVNRSRSRDALESESVSSLPEHSSTNTTPGNRQMDTFHTTAVFRESMTRQVKLGHVNLKRCDPNQHVQPWDRASVHPEGDGNSTAPEDIESGTAALRWGEANSSRRPATEARSPSPIARKGKAVSDESLEITVAGEKLGTAGETFQVGVGVTNSVLEDETSNSEIATSRTRGPLEGLSSKNTFQRPKQLIEASQSFLSSAHSSITSFRRSGTIASISGSFSSLIRSRAHDAREDGEFEDLTILDMFDLATAIEARDCILKRIADRELRLAETDRGGLLQRNDSVEGLGGIDENSEQPHFDSGLRMLVESLQTMVYSMGEVIYPVGALSRSIFFIVAGEVIAYNCDGDLLMRRGRGDIFGEVSYYQTGNWGSTQEWTAGSKRVVIRELPGTLIDSWRVEEPMRAALLNRYLTLVMCQVHPSSNEIVCRLMARDVDLHLIPLSL